MTWATAEDQRNFDKVCSTTPGKHHFCGIDNFVSDDDDYGDVDSATTAKEVQSDR